MFSKKQDMKQTNITDHLFLKKIVSLNSFDWIGFIKAVSS